MVNLKELKLYNLLLCTANPMDPFYCSATDIHQYDYFTRDGDKVIMGNGHMYPLVLIPETLALLGFTKTENDREYRFYQEEDDTKIWLVLVEGGLNFDTIRVNIHDKDGQKPEFYFKSAFLYVHQLQNAFFLLTNHELDLSNIPA